VGVGVGGLLAVAVGVGLVVDVAVGVEVAVGVGVSDVLVKVQWSADPGARLWKTTSLSPGSKPVVGLPGAPVILKTPPPLVNWQAMFVSVQPGGIAVGQYGDDTAMHSNTL